MQLTRRLRVHVAVHDVADLVGIFLVDALQRHTGKAVCNDAFSGFRQDDLGGWHRCLLYRRAVWSTRG